MAASNGNQLVRTHEIEWKPLPEAGISDIYVKVLQYDQEAKRAPTILLKFAPGATYPLHTHPGGEEIFVLEGELTVGKDHLRAGDYLYTVPDGKHAVRSAQGCIVLLKAPQATIEIKTAHY